MTTLPALDDIDAIRRLLHDPARRRPPAAPNRPSFLVDVPTPDGRPRLVRVYADDASWRPGFVARVTAARAARPERVLRGMPTDTERDERRQRALARLAEGSLVRGHVARRDVLRLDAVFGGWR